MARTEKTPSLKRRGTILPTGKGVVSTFRKRKTVECASLICAREGAGTDEIQLGDERARGGENPRSGGKGNPPEGNTTGKKKKKKKVTTRYLSLGSRKKKVGV